MRSWILFTIEQDFNNNNSVLREMVDFFETSFENLESKDDSQRIKIRPTREKNKTNVKTKK